MSQFVVEGEVIQVILNDSDVYIANVCKTKLKLGRARLNLENLVGLEFGRLYQLNGDLLEPVTDSFIDNMMNTVESDSSLPLDNSEYIDTNTSQKLERDDISEMKAGGASGNEIVKALVENSDTWNKKTMFAKKKYLLKKSKKHIVKIRLLPISSKAVCDFALRTKDDRVCNLRYDTMCRLIGQADVASGSTVLAFDDVLGLVIGCVAAKLRGNGMILAPYLKSCPSFNLFGKFGFNEIDSRVIQPYPISMMRNMITPSVEIVVDVELPLIEVIEAKQQEIEEKVEEIDDDMKCDNDNDETSKLVSIPVQSLPSDYKKRELRNGDLVQIKQVLTSNYNRNEPSTNPAISSLIIATRCRPLDILKLGLPFLSPGRPFVVYCEYLNPLVECYEHIKSNMLGVNIIISDLWTRNYVVSEAVTHPIMNMSGCSGYLLVGIKIESSIRPSSFPEPNNKRKNHDKGKRKRAKFE